MRLAIISDIHGNMNALNSVLAHIESQNVDRIVCAGDLIDPLPESREVWRKLYAQGIPMIQGNHEDYVAKFLLETDTDFHRLENWRPVQATAKLFSNDDALKLRALPLNIVIDEIDLMICHASPQSNSVGWQKGISTELARELNSVKQSTIICGHWHEMREERWNEKKLVMVGSVGVPLNSKPLAQYAIVDSVQNENGFDHRVQHQLVPYDNVGAARKYAESGMVQEGAPVAYLLFDEVLTAERRIYPFFAWRKSSPELAAMSWAEAVETFLRTIGRWNEIRKFF